jgi:hypothetical protein
LKSNGLRAARAAEDCTEPLALLQLDEGKQGDGPLEEGPKPKAFEDG